LVHTNASRCQYLAANQGRRSGACLKDRDRITRVRTQGEGIRSTGQVGAGGNAVETAIRAAVIVGHRDIATALVEVELYGAVVVRNAGGVGYRLGDAGGKRRDRHHARETSQCWFVGWFLDWVFHELYFGHSVCWHQGNAFPGFLPST